MIYENINQLPHDFSYELTVTPKLAYSILNDGKLEEAHRSTMNPATIAYLRERIREGEFEDGKALIFILYKGRLYLGNGRHSMTALIQMKHTAMFVAHVFPVKSRKAIPKVLWDAHLRIVDVATQFSDVPGFESYINNAGIALL